jgi:uncharacterized protein with HEPN domain
MREEARLANSFTDGVDYEGFMRNEEKKRAVTQTLANIGELCRILSDGVKARYKSVPWAAIRKTRNVITHDYESVDFTDIWHSATIDALSLASEIDTIERDIGVALYSEAEREANYNEILKAIKEADELGE